ncbi:MAG TPA: FkbM family methyltransferase [Cytophagales bacterium]|nr:FkbM family methyltransferase [Cytophagales bacterium]
MSKDIFLETNQTNYLTKCLFWDKSAKFEYNDIFINLSQHITTFFDIGANIGYYSVLMSKLNPQSKTFSFEPATGPHHYLQTNAQINGLSNMRVEFVALSNQEGKIDFYEVRNKKYKYLKYNLAGTGSMVVSKKDQFNKYTVSTIQLDNYVKSNNISRVDLIKIDTEGTEDLVLDGGKEVLDKHKPIVVCETLFNSIEDKLDRIFKMHGYEMYYHLPEGLKKVETITRDHDNGVYNCFFVHPSKRNLIQDFVI